MPTRLMHCRRTIASGILSGQTCVKPAISEQLVHVRHWANNGHICVLKEYKDFLRNRQPRLINWPFEKKTMHIVARCSVLPRKVKQPDT